MISSDVLFDSYNSRTDLGLIFTHAEKNPPETHTEYAEVPGRGPVDLSELVAGEPWYLTRELVIEFEYTGTGWAAKLREIFGKLHGKKMQIVFQDDPQWYFTGRCAVEYEVNMSTLHFVITVTADPFRHFVDQTPTTFSGAGTITNPTLFSSRPLIRVNGSGTGTVTIGNQIITLNSIDGYVDIDSELMDCYKGLVNCNANVVLDEFPTLPPGATGISFTGGVTSVAITGRWRAL